MHRPSFRWRYFALAALVALALHAGVLPPMFRPLLERPERPVEVAFVDDDGAPTLPPATAAEPSPPPAPEPLDRERRLRPDKDQPPPPRPEPPRLVQPVPPPRPEPPPPDRELFHKKFVDQDKFADEQDNADAKYLAQKNHRAEHDTHALNTNLVRDMRGPTSTPVERSDSKLPDPGMKDSKVAELKKQAGEEHQVVRTRARQGDDGQAPRTTPGKLSMRGLTPRAIEQRGAQVTPREGVELHDDAPGPLAAARQGNAGVRAGSRAKGRPNLTLDALDYDKIVGESVARSERQKAARGEVSHAEGRWARLEKKQAALRSSLENFTPDAYTGRESELGTRAHPYAAYIAEVHRGIHKLWAFSFLPALDAKGVLDPFNDMTRYTRIALVITEGGELESARISRGSGYLPFDAAALDVVMSAAPFPRPPEAIKSYDGKVYIDWVFHRDGRQCGTDFVDAHILTGDKHGSLEPRPGPLHAHAHAHSPL